MAYSRDYKKRTIEYRAEGHTVKETMETFKIGRTAYYEWEREAEEGFADKPKRTYEKKIDKVKLAKAVEETPDAELAELAVPFNCSVQAIFYALKKMGITLKKRHLHTLKSPKKKGKSI
jgi:transposase